MAIPIVSVIVPTVATAERAACLERAVRSVLSQEGVTVQVIIVANGPNCDPELMAELERRPGIRLFRSEVASFSEAIKAGRRLVDTPYFAELDDDDEFLPHALSLRLDRFREEPSIDVVVTSGLIRSAGGEAASILDIHRVRRDPLRTVLDDIWLLPGSAMYRTETVEADLFDGIPASLEWTYLALLLALRKKISFIDNPTFVYYRDTPQSLSKSKHWLVSQPVAVHRMLQLDLPSDVRSGLRQKYVNALHDASSVELEAGCRAQAWRWHLMGMAYPSGWRYLPYTRHLLRRLVRQ